MTYEAKIIKANSAKKMCQFQEKRPERRETVKHKPIPIHSLKKQKMSFKRKMSKIYNYSLTSTF